MGHAVLSPSAASRWLACTPSARLEERFPDNAGDFAKEGTLAHEFGQTLLTGLLDNEDMAGMLDTLRNDTFYTHEMEDYAEGYASFVWEEFCRIRQNTPDAILRIEEKIDLTDYVPDGFGTGDAVIIADNVLTVIDLKYGKGVKVSAIENKQMMLYALGTLSHYEIMYGVDKVRMIIYQPRLGNVSEWQASAEVLKNWADNYLKPRARLAFDGAGDYVPGEHCRFCRAKAQCKALAEKNIEAAKHEFDEVGLMSDEEVAAVLAEAEGIKTWIMAVEEYALKAALEGKKFPGFKLVEGRSVRRYADESKVAKTLLDCGYKAEQIYKPQELKTITALEKLLTKKAFNTLLSDLVVKPAGKPTLVAESDARPEWSSAEADFKEVPT